MPHSRATSRIHSYQPPIPHPRPYYGQNQISTLHLQRNPQSLLLYHVRLWNDPTVVSSKPAHVAAKFGTAKMSAARIPISHGATAAALPIQHRATPLHRLDPWPPPPGRQRGGHQYVLNYPRICLKAGGCLRGKYSLCCLSNKRQHKHTTKKN